MVLFCRARNQAHSLWFEASDLSITLNGLSKDAGHPELLVEFATKKKNHIGMHSVGALPTSLGLHHSSACQQPPSAGIWEYLPVGFSSTFTIHGLLSLHSWQSPAFPVPSWVAGWCGPHCIPGSLVRLSSGFPLWWCACSHTFYLLPALIYITSFLSYQRFLCHFPTYKINSFIESLVSRATVG